MGHGGDQYSWVALLVLDGVFFCLLALLVRRLWRKGSVDLVCRGDT